MRQAWRRVFGILVCLTLVANLAGWLPAAHAAIISTQQEIAIGRDVAKQIERQFGLVNDLELQERISRIGNRIAAISDRKDLPYTFKVINSKEINALACPGGFIYIFKGLVDYMPSDDELAGIIGHEVGHVVKRHTVHQIEKSYLYTIGFAVLFGDKGGGILQNLALNAIMAGYSRADEQEADYLGFIHSVRAGYNPYSILIGMEKLAELKHEGGNWFSSHPDPESRVGLIKRYIKDAKIHPQVEQKGNAAQVVDTGLSLPPLSANYRGYKPLYRAYFAAGVLYEITTLPGFSGDRFILDSDGTNITVYYDDYQIITLTPQDASTNNTNLEGLASQYVEALKIWSNANKP